MKKEVARTIEYKASEFRKMCSIEADEPVNIKQTLRKLNVLTLYRPLADNFSGMCLRNQTHKFILVNSNHPRGRQHFTIAHEFYHLFIQKDFEVHPCNPGMNKELQEQEADCFASALLIPEILPGYRFVVLDIVLDFLSLAYHKKILNGEECDAFITAVLQQGSKLPVRDCGIILPVLRFICYRQASIFSLSPLSSPFLPFSPRSSPRRAYRVVSLLCN